MPATLYGFKSCDTVKKARAWLDARGAKYDFYDYRVKPLDPAALDRWFNRAGWEAVLNRNSTTYKELPEADKAGLDERKARAMILAETNLIKRPVFELGDALLFGFREKQYETALAAG
jgi:Spx/MgsR family transcriptional regulator